MSILIGGYCICRIGLRAPFDQSGTATSTLASESRPIALNDAVAWLARPETLASCSLARVTNSIAADVKIH